MEEVRRGIASAPNIDEALRDLEVDSDTQGVAGQPPIVETILKKIDASAVFVADMTFVGKRLDGRPTPNPNVLIEYGWALKGGTHERVICLMNTAYGEPSGLNLPFNLRHLRWPITYTLAEDALLEIKAQEKRKLVKILDKAIRDSLAAAPSPILEMPSPFPEAKAKNGPARFRSPGEAIGFENDFPLSSSKKEIFLSEGPTVWFRLMPKNDPGKKWATYELKNIVTQDAVKLLPIIHSTTGYSYLRAEDGAGMYAVHSRDTQEVHSIAFAFETGEIWSVDTTLLSYATDRIFSTEIDRSYISGLQNYSRFLQSLGVKPPYLWIAGLVGIKGRYLRYPDKSG